MIQPESMSGVEPDQLKKAKEPEIIRPKGSEVSAIWRQPDGTELPYRCRAQWTVLREEEKPVAEMFYTSYFLEEAGDRPITFIFNGGPGAASAYLHVGALGTRDSALKRPEQGATSWLELDHLPRLGHGRESPVSDDHVVQHGDAEGPSRLL